MKYLVYVLMVIFLIAPPFLVAFVYQALTQNSVNWYLTWVDYLHSKLP